MQIAVLAMLFRTHLGKESDKLSLCRWITTLGKDKWKLWDGQNNLVKNFRSCLAFWGTILDGSILAETAQRCGFRNVGELLSDFPEVEKLGTHIEDLALGLTKFNTIRQLRSAPDAERDLASENRIMLMQHGLALCNSPWPCDKGTAEGCGCH